MCWALVFRSDPNVLLRDLIYTLYVLIECQSAYDRGHRSCFGTAHLLHVVRESVPDRLSVVSGCLDGAGTQMSSDQMGGRHFGRASKVSVSSWPRARLELNFVQLVANFSHDCYIKRRIAAATRYKNNSNNNVEHIRKVGRRTALSHEIVYKWIGISL